jgi:two-component system, NtrC family, response regulator AtoC
MTVTTLLASDGPPHSVDRLVGDSPLMVSLKQFLTKVATSPASTFLVTGESGTGKDLAARILHHCSSRAHKSLTRVGCWDTAAGVLESELFGDRSVFERADGGTVILDDIGELPVALQPSLLRMIEEKCLRRPVDPRDIPVDVRVIAMSHGNLEEEVEDGRFCEDLYHRLNTLPIAIPALRQHLEDVPALVAYYVAWFNRELRKEVIGLSPSGMRALQAYRWPGNIRELRNAVERAMLVATGPTLDISDFLLPGVQGRSSTGFELPLQGVDLESLERSLVIQALQRCGGNQTRAAVLLGMNRDQIRYRIEKYALPRPVA